MSAAVGRCILVIVSSQDALQDCSSLNLGLNRSLPHAFGRSIAENEAFIECWRTGLP